MAVASETAVLAGPIALPGKSNQTDSAPRVMPGFQEGDRGGIVRLMRLAQSTCHQGLADCTLTPLGQGGGSAVCENVAAIELAWVVAIGVDRGLDGGACLQGLDVSDPSHGPCPPSQGLL